MPAVDKSRGSKSVEVRRVWELYDDRLQYMSQRDAFLLNESLDIGDVSRAWLVWSRAAETALADAYCFSAGPAPCHGLVLGRGLARFQREVCTGDAWNLPSEGTGVVGFRLVSPAEGTGALALVRF